MKKTILALTLLIFALIGFGIFVLPRGESGLQKSRKLTKQKMLPTVRVNPASLSTISRVLKLTGSVEPYRIAKLASPAEGPVVTIRVREGDRVKSDERLLTIGRKKGADALISSLQEELKKEEDNLQRVRQLVEGEAIPDEEYDQARATFEKIKAQLVSAKEKAQDYTITAPWEGIVSRLIVKEGEFVAPRSVLLEMYDPASLVIRAAVPEKHAAEVTAGMRVDVHLDAYPNNFVPGRIERVYPYLDPRLRTRTIEIALDKSVNLLPGMFARLEVLLESEEEAVTVPIEALVSTPKGQVVYVFEDGQATARMVETGIEADNRIEIISGIQAGDKVIAAGNEKLKNGADVRLAGDEKSGKGENKDIADQPVGQSGMTGDGQ